ncbi:hypothetical protein J1N10_14360 [Carboxylicivirga sp. A043]|uniref:hypothetical protein n=1 Tax=Carboxylicivirga litoralis TaxID=2816963 RepID=UPI0021CB5C5F|nr:hypothetical protein [Carboxylicivirga sp. A043]MCU4157166.1 hypothetical protein [Carboxylicivirga sp. A043]
MNKNLNLEHGRYYHIFKARNGENLFKESDNYDYFHNNTVHHGFCDHMIEYCWSSYQSIISLKETKLQRDKLVGCFDGVKGFISYHHDNIDYQDIEALIKL